MNLENLSSAQILIIIHATLGGLALLFGAIALSVKKGGKIHKSTGKLFFYTMLGSAIVALVISTLPHHKNPFLFTIGVFSSYFLITGYLALKYRNSNLNLAIDKLVSWMMIITGFAMILYPIYLTAKPNIIMTVFGLIGIVFSIRDIKLFTKHEKLKSMWLKLHLSKMIAGYISALTAFMVVNNFFHPLIGWLGPGIIGGFYIAYWIRKVDLSKKIS